MGEYVMKRGIQKWRRSVDQTDSTNYKARMREPNMHVLGDRRTSTGSESETAWKTKKANHTQIRVAAPPDRRDATLRLSAPIMPARVQNSTQPVECMVVVDMRSDLFTEDAPQSGWPWSSLSVPPKRGGLAPLLGSDVLSAPPPGHRFWGPIKTTVKATKKAQELYISWGEIFVGSVCET